MGAALALAGVLALVALGLAIRLRQASDDAARVPDLERSLAEARTAAAEDRAVAERLRQAIDTLPQGVVIATPNGTIVARNKVATEVEDARHGEVLVRGAVDDLLVAALEGQAGERTIELFGPPTLIRPETQAMWPRNLPERDWQRADAVFEKMKGGEDSPGQCLQRRQLPDQWQMHHNNLKFWFRPTPFRHTGVFPETNAH